MYCLYIQAKRQNKKWKRGDKTTFSFHILFWKIQKNFTVICAQLTQKHRYFCVSEKKCSIDIKSRCTECDFLAQFFYSWKFSTSMYSEYRLSEAEKYGQNKYNTYVVETKTIFNSNNEVLSVDGKSNLFTGVMVYMVAYYTRFPFFQNTERKKKMVIEYFLTTFIFLWTMAKSDFIHIFLIFLFYSGRAEPFRANYVCQYSSREKIVFRAQHTNT